MTQCCPLSTDHGDGPSCSYSEIRKARKAHVCCECREAIHAGTRYEHCSGIWDGGPSAYKTCLSCVEIRNHFACQQGWMIGEVWSQLQENFFPDMNAGGPCMQGLSPAAKLRLVDKRMEWYFAQDEIDDSQWKGWTPDKPPRPRPVDTRTTITEFDHERWSVPLYPHDPDDPD